MRTVHNRTVDIEIFTLETECPLDVTFLEIVYLETPCPYLYGTRNGGASRPEIWTETLRRWTGDSLSLRGLDADIWKIHRLQIEYIRAYHFILRGPVQPTGRFPKRPLRL
jgi:hypothetical protein